MAASKDQQRIVALQKQLKIARGALEIARYGDLKPQKAEEALDEMNKLEWASKPNLVQDDNFRGRSIMARR